MTDFDFGEYVNNILGITNKTNVALETFEQKNARETKEYVEKNKQEIIKNLNDLTNMYPDLTNDQKKSFRDIDNINNTMSIDPSEWKFVNLIAYNTLCTLKTTIKTKGIGNLLIRKLNNLPNLPKIKAKVLDLNTKTQISPLDNKSVIPVNGIQSQYKNVAKELNSELAKSPDVKKIFTLVNAGKAIGYTISFALFLSILGMLIFLVYEATLPVALNSFSDNLSGCYMFSGSNDAVKLEGCSAWYGQSVDNQLLCTCGTKATPPLTAPDCNTLTGECGAPYCIGKSCTPTMQGDTACSYQKEPIFQCSGTSSVDPNYVFYSFRQYPPSSLVAGAISTNSVINNYSSTTTTSNINKIIMYVIIGIVILIVLFFIVKFILNKMNKGQIKKIKNKK